MSLCEEWDGKTAQCACVSSASVNLCMSACVYLFLLVAHWPSHPWGELHLVQAVPVSCDWPRPAVFAALQRLQAPQAAGHFPGLSKLMINQVCKSEAWRHGLVRLKNSSTVLDQQLAESHFHLSFKTYPLKSLTFSESEGRVIRTLASSFLNKDSRGPWSYLTVNLHFPLQRLPAGRGICFNSSGIVRQGPNDDLIQ